MIRYSFVDRVGVGSHIVGLADFRSFLLVLHKICTSERERKKFSRSGAGAERNNFSWSGSGAGAERKKAPAPNPWFQIYVPSIGVYLYQELYLCCVVNTETLKLRVTVKQTNTQVGESGKVTR